MDGTTATTLAPSEDEMRKVTEVFAQMRDAVIASSQLASEVQELRNAVGSLRNELESLRSTNRWMDGQITELRQQRDEALAAKEGAQSAYARVTHERDDLQRHCDNQRATLAGLNEQVAALRKERDEAQYEAESYKDAVKGLQAKLDAVIGLVCPKPEPVPVPIEQPRDPVTQQWLPKDDVARAEGYNRDYKNENF